MFEPQRERFTAWVIFQGAEHRRAWRIFTRRGWRHCMVIVPAYDPAPGLNARRLSVLVNATTNFCGVQTFMHSPQVMADEALKNGATCVIKFHVDRIGQRDYVPRGFLTCVSLVKAILGIRAWFIVSPYGLARWLLCNGGEVYQSKGQAHVSTVRRQGERA